MNFHHHHYHHGPDGRYWHHHPLDPDCLNDICYEDGPDFAGRYSCRGACVGPREGFWNRTYAPPTTTTTTSNTTSDRPHDPLSDRQMADMARKLNQANRVIEELTAKVEALEKAKAEEIKTMLEQKKD